MDEYTCRHFSLANALDDEPGDLARLLRRMADKIESIGVQPDAILDLTIESQTIETGPWWSATLYWSAADA